MNSGYVMAMGCYLMAAAVLAHHGIRDGVGWTSATVAFAFLFSLATALAVFGDRIARRAQG